MSSPFVAEIRIFACNFAPTGWAQCNGQLLPISQNTALFSLLGTNFGGDGKSNFGLPNLQGTTPLFWQQGPGLSDYVIGEQGGETAVTLLQSELPSHNHSASATTNPGTLNDPNGNLLSEGAWDNGQGASGKVPYYSSTTSNAQMNPNAISIVGGGLPHNNMMPYLTLNFCIALQGIFPPRT